MAKMKEKMGSPVMWLAIVALLIVILKDFFGIDTMGAVNEFSDVVLGLVAAFGILNNPNDRSGF